MSKSFKTDQEKFWAGDFGDEYIERNFGAQHVAKNTALFANVLKSTRDISSVVEFGPNIGLNLLAVKHLLPDIQITGVEINEKAAETLGEIDGIDVIHQSFLEYEPKGTFDLAFTKGVLIHINPDELPRAYDILAQSSKRYVFIAEYYSRNPEAIPYRGHDDRLWKRDFGGEFLDAHPEYSLVDYGFVYHRDPVFPRDDLTWFLMEKK